MLLLRCLGLSLALLLSLSDPTHADLDGGAIKMVVSNYPLAYFAERLGGMRVHVALPMPSDEDPAFWRPDAKAIAQMQRADLIVLNGANYEKWLPKVSLPKLKQVDTSASFKDALIHVENAVTHSHGPGGMHSHSGIAFTTWLDFEQAGKQAEELAKALIRKRPELKSVIQDNLQKLSADLQSLDEQTKVIAAKLAGKPLLASHPIYQYLARRYGLNVQSVHWEPGEMPPTAEWAALGKMLESHPAHSMLWEGQPSNGIASRLKAMGVASIVFEPCANRPGFEDFFAVMKQNLLRLQSAR